MLPLTRVFVNFIRMTERKLQKYLNKALPPVVGSKTLTPVILTDSKAKYLIKHCSSTVQSILAS